MRFGGVGVPLWYCYEMLARQEYYTQKFSNKIAMHHVALEDLTTKAGAQDFHKAHYDSGLPDDNLPSDLDLSAHGLDEW